MTAPDLANPKQYHTINYEYKSKYNVKKIYAKLLDTGCISNVLEYQQG